MKYCIGLGTRWLGGMRNCAKSRKAADTIPDGVTGIFHWPNPSGPGVYPVLRRNEYYEYLLGVKRPMRRADKLTNFMCPVYWNMGASTS